MNRHSISFFALAAVALLHCGDDSDSDKGSSKQPIVVNEQNFTQAFSEAVCKNIAPCCAKAGYPYSELGCSMSAVFFANLGFAPGKAPPNTTWNQANAEACIEKVRDGVAACVDDSVGATPECARVYEGTIEPGAACSLDVECKASGAGKPRCESKSFGEANVCWTELSAAVGEPCGTDKATFTKRTCKGEGKSAWCDSGTCKPSEGGGTCSGPCKPDGQACASADECANRTCTRGKCGPITDAAMLCGG